MPAGLRTNPPPDSGPDFATQEESQDGEANPPYHRQHHSEPLDGVGEPENPLKGEFGGQQAREEPRDCEDPREPPPAPSSGVGREVNFADDWGGLW